MAIPRMNDDMDVIAKLADRPNDTQGLTAAQLKARFDKSGVDIQKYINDTLLPYLESGAAASNMGIEEITGLDAETVQAALEELYDDKDVFWATYGSTTYSEVKAAYEAGKPVLCEYNGRYYLLTRPAAPGDINIYFTSPANVSNTGVSVYCVYVDYVNGWHATSATVQPTIITPLMDGEANVGSTYSYARADHVHPSDTSKADVEDVPTKTSDLTNDSGFITASDVPAEVFWATYGTTTYSEIGAALTAGKLVVCEYSGIYYSYHYRIIDTRYFSSEEGYWLTVTSGNVWSQGQKAPPSAATATPLMDGTAAVGSSSKYSLEDHVHPSDTSKITMPGSGTTGQVLKKTADGVEWANESGGGGGTSDYDDLTDKPSINSVTLSGNKSTSDLGLDQVFIATYGTTTNAQIETAYSAGKMVFAADSSDNVATLEEIVIGEDFALFTFYHNGYMAVWQCENDTWTWSSKLIPSAYTSSPAMDGTASAGSSANYAKGDHVHPTDTSRLAANQGSGNAGKFLVVGSDGVVTPVTMATWQGGSY